MPPSTISRQSRSSCGSWTSEKGREKGMSQFLDEKTYRPGIQPYNRPSEKAS